MLVLTVAIALAALEVPTGLADVPPEMPAPLIPVPPGPDDASEPRCSATRGRVFEYMRTTAVPRAVISREGTNPMNGSTSR